jgi:nickel transport protein
MIDESLDRKIAPIANMLASLNDRGPGLTEIIGGIGYICGLAGVALYLASRKRNN